MVATLCDLSINGCQMESATTLLLVGGKKFDPRGQKETPLPGDEEECLSQVDREQFSPRSIGEYLIRWTEGKLIVAQQYIENCSWVDRRRISLPSG